MSENTMDDVASFEEAANMDFDLNDELGEGESGDIELGEDGLSFEDSEKLVDEEESEEKPEDKSDDDSEKETEEPEEKEQPSKEEEEKEDKPEIKKLTAKVGEEEVEIAADAQITHKVDGKEVTKTLQEWLNEGSGQMAAAQRFSQLAKERTDFKIEKNDFESKSGVLVDQVNGFVKAVNEGDADGAISSLADLSGVNRVELRQHFKDLMIDQVKAYLQMTPEEQKEFDMQQEMNYHKQLSADLEANKESKQSVADLENSILKFQVNNGLSNEELVALYDKAEANQIEINSAEDLERYHQEQLTQNKASSLLSQVETSLADNTEAIAIVNDFIAKNPEFSDEEVIKAIQASLIDEDKPEETKPPKKDIEDKIKSKQQKNAKKPVDNAIDFEEDDDDILLFSDMDL